MSDDKQTINSNKKAFDDRKLIDLVKENPQLYNQNHTDYANHAVKDEIWERISKKMNCDVEICKRKWDTFRCQFRKIYKLDKNGLCTNKRQWKHYKQMQFLGPYMSKLIQREPELINTDTINVKFEPVDANDQDLIDSVAGCSNVEGTDPLQVDLKNSNEEFFNSIALTLNSFPEEHQLRIKAIVLQQINEVQMIMENSTNFQFPVNPFTQPNT